MTRDLKREQEEFYMKDHINIKYIIDHIASALLKEIGEG